MKKYCAIECDYNYPGVKVLAVPLESDYGVAVKLKRNGETLTSDILVGEVAASGARGGYQLFDLSSGTQEKATDYAISGEYGKFSLRVYETNKNYIEKWSESEPTPQWDVISGSKTFVADITGTDEVYSESSLDDPVWIYAKQVKSFTCTYSDNGGPKQTIASFMNVQVQDYDDGAYFFCHAGDPSNGNIWYESEGGMSAEKTEIKVAGNFRTIHFPVEEGHTYEIEWKLEYDADMVFQELSASGSMEVEEGESEATEYIFQSTSVEPIILSAGQVADFSAYSSGNGDAFLTDGPYIYDINGNSQRWTGNKWYDGENYSDYIEIGPESYFGAYFDFGMAGEYTTTFSLKYVAEEE